MPEQKMLSGAVWSCVNVWVAGFHTSVGSGCCQPSNCRTFPLSIRIEWIATIGQLSSGAHSPRARRCRGHRVRRRRRGPVPTALVAVTVNV